MYVVFEGKSTIPKVHSVHCEHYQRWIGEQSTKTTVWHGPYDTYGEAMEKCREIAWEKKQYPRNAGCCEKYLGGIKDIITTLPFFF